MDSQAKPDETVSAQQGEPSEHVSASAVVTAAVGSVQQAAVGEPSPASSTGTEEKRSDLKSTILAIIRLSEGGITLSAIAEKMKRHFASLIGPVRLLIEEGLVEKQDKIYEIRGTG